MSEFYTSIERVGNRVLYRGYRDGNPVEQEIQYEPHLFVPSMTPTDYVVALNPKQYLNKKIFGSISEFSEYVETFKGVQNFKLYGCSNIIRQFTASKFTGEIQWDFDLVKVWYWDVETKAEWDSYSSSHAIKIRKK